VLQKEEDTGPSNGDQPEMSVQAPTSPPEMLPEGPGINLVNVTIKRNMGTGWK